MIKITAVDPQDLPAILRIKTCQPSCASNDLALTRPKLELLLSIRHGSISLPIRFWQHATPISSLALSSVQSLMRVLNILKTGCMKLTYKIALNLAATR